MERTHKLTVKVGKDFVVDLPSNPTSGYMWEAHYDKALLECLGTDYESTADKLGGGGRQVFRFVARRKGDAVIRMLYRRPWDQETVRETVYAVAVGD